MALPHLVRLFGEEATKNPVEPFARHFARRIRHAMEGTDDVAEFLRRHLVPVFQYADAIRREVCHRPTSK